MSYQFDTVRTHRYLVLPLSLIFIANGRVGPLFLTRCQRRTTSRSFGLVLHPFHPQTTHPPAEHPITHGQISLIIFKLVISHQYGGGSSNRDTVLKQ